jgi:tetratricopeptide (TPR) repeat protein
MVEASTTTAPRPQEAWAWLLALAIAALVFGVTFFGGASGDGSVFWLGLVAALIVTGAGLGAALGLVRLPALDGTARAAVALALALVGWLGLTIVWSIAGDRSWSVLNKGLLYLLLLACGLLLGVLGPRTARAAATILAVVIGLALAWALAGKAIPTLFPDGDRIARLRNPVGYWNGLALLADAALALGLWLSSAERRVAHAGGALLVYGAVLSLLLTESRAGVIAGGAVVALWLLLSHTRVRDALVTVVAGIPGLVVGIWAFSRPALVEDGAGRSARVDDGAVFGALALAGAALAVVLAIGLPLARLAVQHRRVVVRGLVAMTVVAAGVALAALVVVVDDPFSEGECQNDPSRFGTLCANNRLDWWSEAIDIWRGHVAAGAGAGTFAIARTPFRDDGAFVIEPHSVPLQLLAGGGIVGLALLLGLAAALAGALVRSVRRLEDGERTAALALVALPAALLVHALVDYPLDFVSVTGSALVAVGAVLAAGRPPRPRPGWLLVAAAAVSALAVVGSLGSPELSTRGVERTFVLLDEGRVGDASDVAEQAQALDPLSLDPLFARAAAAGRAGELAAAHRFYLDATELQPENAEPWYLLGLFRLDVLDDACAGYEALNHAYTLDPNSSTRWRPGGPLDVARDAVNEGACERS